MQFSINQRSLSVGNRIIDTEHKKLGDIINDIGQLILVKHDVALSMAITLLNDALRHYFVVEENIAKAVNFDFTQHNLAHQALLNEIHGITHKLMNQYHKFSDLERKHFIDSLNGCLIQHIQDNSRPLKVVLDNYVYDFKPNLESSESDRQIHTNS
jgi:hemerythrin-like metal-binding protein